MAAHRQDQLRGLAPAVAIAVIGATTIVVCLQFAYHLRETLCPAGTVISSTSSTDAFLVPVFVTIFGSVFGPTLARRLQKATADSAAAGVPSLLPYLYWIPVPLGLLWALLAFNSAYSFYCATPQEIAYRSGFFAATEHHPWSTIHKVAAQCGYTTRKSSKYFYVHLQAIADNGEAFDLARGPVASAVRFVHDALGDGSYIYDISGITERCPPQNRTALLAPDMLLPHTTLSQPPSTK